MKNNIELILTDIGGVIYKSTGMKNAISSFLNQDSKSETVQRIIDIFMDSFIGVISEEQFWNMISIITNKSAEEVYKIIEFFDYTINYEFLNYLKELSKECKIGIISDINSVIYKIIKNNINDFECIFDKNYIFLSYIEQDSKYLSGSKFFDNILNKINIKNNRILFIDDKIENVSSARKSRILALQYIKTENEEKDNQKIISEINEVLSRNKYE